jgi:hypothetical protein
MRSVSVDGRQHKEFDAERETIILPGRLPGPTTVIATY